MKRTNLLIGGLVAAIAAGGSMYARFSEAPQPTPSAEKRGARVITGTPSVKMTGDFKDSKRAKAPARIGEEDLFKPVIYGMLLYSDEWWDLGQDESYPYGCYAFSPNYPQKAEILVHPNLYANGGGCYSNHRLHMRMYGINQNGDDVAFLNYFSCINTDNWSYVTQPTLTYTDTSVANDMTYDRTTNTIYAAVWGNFDGGACRLATVEPLYGETTEIATIPELVCLAANNFGEMYGVERLTGVMYRIFPDGKYVKVGNTGVSAQYAQSATVDPETNIIYWAASKSDDTSALYTLNTSTGKAELKTAFPNNEEFTSIFIEADVKGLDAPAALNNFSTRTEGDNAIVSFAVPVTTFDNKALSGSLTAKLYCDGREVSSKAVTAGENVSFTFVPGAGEHTLVAFVENAVGEGPKTTVSYWTGADLPGAPGNVTLDVTNGKAVLTWTTPTEGLHGGTFNPEDVTYTIVRYPGANLIAQGFHGNRFTENLPGDIANYYYTVTACLNDEEGGKATSNSFFAGETFTVPYIQTFDDADGFNGYTALDGDGDGYTWEFKPQWQAVSTRFNSTEQQNDWLITPPVKFAPNSTYQLTFKARAFDSDSPERFEVKLGAAPQPEAMTTTLLSVVQTNNTDYDTYTASFKTDAEGVLYIGFHCTSYANSYRLIVDDIEIKLTEATAVPAAVTNLKAEAATDGSNNVKISFTAPTTLANGSALSELTSISIFRGTNNAPIKTFDKPAPGSNLSYTDEGAPMGEQTYRVIAYNGAGAGLEAAVKAYAGYDVPQAPTNLRLVFDEDKNLHLTWDAPTHGVSGAALNPSALFYEIVRSDNVMMKETHQGQSYTDNSLQGEAEQSMIYYQVTSIHGTTRGQSALSGFVIIGDDLQMPFAESFTEANLDNVPWTISRITNHTGMCWSLQRAGVNPTAIPEDDDNGFASFISVGKDSGLIERMTSPKMDLFSAQHPVIRFYMYNTTADCSETLTVQITHNDGEFTTLRELPLKGTKEGWNLYEIEIPRKECLPASSIAFLATTGGQQNIHLDNISVINGNPQLAECDLEAVSLEVPALVPDKEAKLTLNVYNNGSEAVESYNVALLVNGAVAIQAKSTEPIEAGETYKYIFTLTPEKSDLNQTFRFKGTVSCTGDSNLDNNETDEVEATVRVSAIDSVVLDEDTLMDVFTLDGVTVLKGITKKGIKALEGGVYIIKAANGHTYKVAVK